MVDLTIIVRFNILAAAFRVAANFLIYAYVERCLAVCVPESPHRYTYSQTPIHTVQIDKTANFNYIK